MSSDDENLNDSGEEDFDFSDESEGLDEDFGARRGSLGEAFRSNPGLKIVVVLVVFAVLVGAVMFFGESEDALPSLTPQTPDVREAPGSDVSREMERAIQQQNQTLREQAEEEGRSAIPVPVGTPRSVPDVQYDDDANADGLAKWRQLQQQRLAEQQEDRKKALENQQRLQFQQQVQQEAEQDFEQAVNQLAGAMQQQMTGIIGEQVPQEFALMQLTTEEAYLAEQEQIRQQALIRQAQMLQQQRQMAMQQAVASGAVQTKPEVIIRAGEIEYGQLLLEANTDAPGPVLAQLVSGPLKGARLIGNFETQYDFLTLQFSTLVAGDETVAITAVALDPNTKTPGLVTEIDRRYFSRVVLPTAAAFIQGFGEAVSESGTTTVVVEDGVAVQEEEDLDTREELFAAVNEAGSVLSSLVQERADEIQPLLRIAAGTPVGVFFLAPVVEPSAQQQYYGAQAAGQQVPYGPGQQQQYFPPYATQQATPNSVGGANLGTPRGQIPPPEEPQPPVNFVNPYAVEQR